MQLATEAANTPLLAPCHPVLPGDNRRASHGTFLARKASSYLSYLCLLFLTSAAGRLGLAAGRGSPGQWAGSSTAAALCAPTHIWHLHGNIRPQPSASAPEGTARCTECPVKWGLAICSYGFTVQQDESSAVERHKSLKASF